jgi:hypothetical protein
MTADHGTAEHLEQTKAIAQCAYEKRIYNSETAAGDSSKHHTPTPRVRIQQQGTVPTTCNSLQCICHTNSMTKTSADTDMGIEQAHREQQGLQWSPTVILQSLLRFVA